MSPAQKKLCEAEFFFSLMHRSVNDGAFIYFLSAFLSALRSCGAPAKLNSKDKRYPEWYETVKQRYLHDPVLVRLGKLRDVEVHQKGVETLQTAGMSFPEGIDMAAGSFVEVDFRSGAPTGRYRTSESAPVLEHPVTVGWVWETPDHPDVMDLCMKGLQIIRAVLDSRDAMRFAD